MNPPVSGQPRWWQWPTVLSLDAPAVALLWQWQLARVAGTTVRPAQAEVLGASIWLSYAADRWIEGWRLAPRQVLTERHRFYQRWRWPAAAAWLVVLAADLRLAFTGLSTGEIAAGLVLLAAVLVYLFSHQLIHSRRRWRAPKEICVALLLAGGAVVFAGIAPGADPSRLAGPLALFAFLCFANCALISTWEDAVDRGHGQTSLAIQFRRGAAFARVLPWLAAAGGAWGALAVPGPAQAAAACGLASGLLLAGVDRLQSRLGWQRARVLADVALMTPVVPLIAARLHP